MKRLLRVLAGSALGVALLFGATRQDVIDASPEPIKTGLQRIKMDMDRVASGNGWKVKKAPGSENDSGSGEIPLLKSHGVPN
jgi:hypothetical protein